MAVVGSHPIKSIIDPKAAKLTSGFMERITPVLRVSLLALFDLVLGSLEAVAFPGRAEGEERGQNGKREDEIPPPRGSEKL